MSQGLLEIAIRTTGLEMRVEHQVAWTSAPTVLRLLHRVFWKGSKSNFVKQKSSSFSEYHSAGERDGLDYGCLNLGLKFYMCRRLMNSVNCQHCESRFS